MAKGIKTGGRTAGTVNKTTAETKELLQKIIEGMLNKLEPKERIDAVIKLLPYIVPKQQEIAIDSKPMINGITVTIVHPNEDDN